MAARRTSAASDRRKVNNRTQRGMYVEGNAARKLQEVPERRAPQHRPARRPAETTQRKKTRTASESREIQMQIERNRAKATGMNRVFIIFLTIICIVLLIVSVRYLQLKAQITTNQKYVESLESQLSSLKEENNAYQSQVTNNVDLNRIKKIAIGRLGMRYPTEDQMETYETARSSYVRQYQELDDIN